MKQLFFLLILFTGVAGSYAQTVTDTLNNGVIIIKDARYDLLVNKKAEINKKAADSKKPTKGFRIQVLNTTDRTQALNAKSKLLSLYPEHKTYLMYQAPYFKLRIGNFEEKKDADDLKKELNRLFPTGVFVIPSEIEFKPDKEETGKQ
ncbi:MAG: SPOR domain-containing protein [Chitinophagaceae bacterium]|nr:SPOR domain-containing protein [Chitinophagaceae bacterium]